MVGLTNKKQEEKRKKGTTNSEHTDIGSKTLKENRLTEVKLNPQVTRDISIP